MWCWTKGGFVAQSSQLGRRPEKPTVKMKDITLLFETLFLPERMLQKRGESVLLFDTGAGSDGILAFGVMRPCKVDGAV